MLDDAGRDHFAGRIDDAANRALRSNQRPLPPARIDGEQGLALESAARAVEVPPRDSIHRGDDSAVRPEQRRE